MAGLLGFNHLRKGDDLIAILRRTRPRVSLFFEEALEMVGQVEQEGLVEIAIGRKWLEGSPDQIDPRLRDWAWQPVWPTKEQNHEMGRRLADALVGIAPAVRCFQGYNEAPHYGNVAQLYLFAALELGFVERLQETGRQAVVLNPPVGNLDAEHVMLCDELLARAPFLGAHTYGSQQGQLMMLEAPDYSMRPRLWIDEARRRGIRVPPLIRTEVGTWWPWKPPAPKMKPVTPEAVGDDFMWLGRQMMAEAYEVGACIYCCGSNGDPQWDGFDVSNEPGILARIETWNREHPAAPYVDASVVRPVNDILARYGEGFAALIRVTGWRPVPPRVDIATSQHDTTGDPYRFSHLDLLDQDGKKLIATWWKQGNMLTVQREDGAVWRLVGGGLKRMAETN